MAKQDAKTAMPRLRFPEFQQENPWTVSRIGEVLEVGNGRDYKHLREGPIPVYGSGGYMLSVDDYLYDGESACIGRKGTIDRPVFLSGKFWTVDTLFYTHSFSNCLPYFVYLHFQQIDWLKHNEAGGVPSLSKANIEKIEIAIPQVEEQKKIADCLTSLDEVIAAQGRKVEVLKAHKRGLMQQLFPREGESRPRLRFPEFRNAPEWEQGTLGGVCEVLNNRRIPISGGDRRPGPFPYYGASGVVDFVDNFIFDERLLLVGEDGAKWGAFEETAFIADGKYWVNNHAHVLKPLKVIDTLLANYLTMIDLTGYVTGHAPPKLTLAKLKSIAIVYPQSTSEQQRIADCLAALDTRIRAETDRLAALKTHKRGLMQQLFPAPEAMGA